MGVSLDGFRITAFPSAKAGATARMLRWSGTFQGEMTLTMPMGKRLTRFSLPGMTLVMLWPNARKGKLAASRIMGSAIWYTWKRAKVALLPDSMARRRQISRALRSI